MRRTALITLTAALLSACGWMQSGYDPGHSNANRWENHVTVANVAGLVDHVVPAPDPARAITSYITVNGRLVVADGTTVTAYSTGTCPTPNGSPCPVLWQAPGGYDLASDGSRIFIGTAAKIDVRGLDGTLLGTLPIGGVLITMDRDTVYASEPRVEQTSVFPVRFVVYHDLHRFPAGCDLAQCSVESLGTWDGPTLLTSFDGVPTSDVTVFGGRPYHARIRDGLAVTRDGIHDLADPACQTPAIACPSIRAFTDLQDVSAISPRRIIGIHYDIVGGVRTNHELQWYPSARTRCPGTPSVCSPVARAAVATPGDVVVGGDVVYIRTPSGLDAYAEDGSTGCTGNAPKTCAPLAHYPMGSGSGEIQVVDRRVYVSTGSALHILTIEGDVS